MFPHQDGFPLRPRRLTEENERCIKVDQKADLKARQDNVSRSIGTRLFCKIKG